MDPEPLLNQCGKQDDLEDDNMDYAANIRSDWVDKGGCCGCRIAYFPVGDFYICGHWRARLTVPIAVCLVFIATFVLFIIETSGFLYSNYKFPTKTAAIASYASLSFAFLMLIISYFQVLIRGPGYVPYNWCVKKQDHYDFETMMSSIAVYQEQVEFGRMHERPDRASFSIDARRYVLRADHFCYWTQSWVGQNNIRYFVLLTGWACVYCLLYVGLRYFWAYDVIASAIRTKKFDFLSIIGWICILFLIFIFFFSLRLFLVSAKNISMNLTLIEKWKFIRNYQPVVSPTPNRSCLENCEDVCGTRKCILCWPFPFIGTAAKPEIDYEAPSMYTESTIQRSLL